MITRQAQVVQASEVRMSPQDRSAVRVTTLRKEKVKRLRDARKVHGPSASRLLMLADVIQFAGTTDVFGEDKGESLRALAGAIENYIRADQTANKKLRKKHGELKRDAFGDEQQPPQQQRQVAKAAPAPAPAPALSAAQYSQVAAAFEEFVGRQQLEVRVANSDERLFAALDAAALPAARHDGQALWQLLKRAVDRFAEERGGLAAYEVLHRVAERYSELRWQQQ